MDRLHQKAKKGNLITQTPRHSLCMLDSISQIDLLVFKLTSDKYLVRA